MLTDQHPAYGEVCPHGHLFIPQDDPAALELGHGAVALRLAGPLGLNVFPLKECTKRPATENGFKDASRDPAVIKGWYKGHPARGVGIPTGMVNGLFVVDLDRHGAADGIANFRDWMAENGLELPPGPYAITPSGGVHVPLRLNGRPVASRSGVLPGVDIQSDGKYVAAWPTQVKLPVLRQPGDPGETQPLLGTYTMHGCLCMTPEAPGDFLDALEQLHGTAAGNGNANGAVGAGGDWTNPDIESLISSGIPAGQVQRPVLRDVVWKLVADGRTDAEIWQAWSAIVARTPLTKPGEPWTQRDFEWALRSAREKKPGAMSLTDEAAAWAQRTVTPAVVPQVPAIQTAPRQIKLTPASQIVAAPVVWAWVDGPYGRIPAGSISLFAGREGTGKSSFVFLLAAQVTTGTLPGMWQGQPRVVFVCASEDSWRYTIRPRLEAAGANLDLVFRVEVQVMEGETTTLSLPADNSMLEQAIVEKQAALVVLDPLMSTISDRLDTHVNREVRRALDPLALMADRTGAVIAGVAHFNKSGGTDVLNMINASGAFKEVPRSIFAFAADPDDGSKVITEVKNNLGRMDLPSLAYHIESVSVWTPTGTADAGRIVLDGTSERTVRDILSDQASTEKDGISQAEDYLREVLADGPHLSKEVEADARESRGVSKRTLDRARRKLDIKTKKAPSTRWWISLPEHEGDLIKAAETDLPGKSAKDANAGTVGNVAKDANSAYTGTVGNVGTLPRSAPHDGDDYGPAQNFGDLYGGHAT